MVLTTVLLVEVAELSTLPEAVVMGTSLPTSSVATWVVNHDQGGIGKYLDVGNRMQGIEDHVRRQLGPKQQIESGKGAIERRAHQAGGVHRRLAWRRRRDVGYRSGGGRQEGLDAVAEIVVERDLRNGRVNGDLQLRPVDLDQCALDDAVILLTGVYQQ